MYGRTHRQVGLSKCLASLLNIETKDKKYLDIFAQSKLQEAGNIVAAYSDNFNDRLGVFVCLLPTIVARSLSVQCRQLLF